MGLFGRIIGVGGPAVQDAAGGEPLSEVGEVGGGRVDGQLWFPSALRR